MPYGSGNCPQCGVKFNVNKSSIGTMRRCVACGAKFIVQEPPVTGSSCLTIIVALLIGCGLLVVAACCGITMLGRSLPPPEQVENKPAKKSAVPRDLPGTAGGKSTQASKPAFDIAALCGLTIDGVRKVLGTPTDTYVEPSDEQIKAGADTWDNNFEKDGQELLVTFNVSDRRVIDLFISGHNLRDLRRTWALDDKSQKYRLEPVEALRGGGFTGIKVIPTVSVSEQVVAAKPVEPAKDPEPETKATNVRTWTAKSGKFSTEARFGGMSDGTVTLHKTDGNTIKIQLDQLSATDREWIEARRK